MRELAAFLLLHPSFVFSQNIENEKAEPPGDKIVITYDQANESLGNKFTISLYSVHNNLKYSFIQVIMVDVGEGITSRLK
jgi:hypothetical protein